MYWSDPVNWLLTARQYTALQIVDSSHARVHKTYVKLLEHIMHQELVLVAYMKSDARSHLRFDARS